MDFFRFLRGKRTPTAPIEQKSSQGGPVLTAGKRHEYALKKWKDFAREGYMMNPTVFACVHLAAKNFARVPLYAVNDKGEKQPDSKLQSLLDRPNPDESGVEFRQAANSWFNLTGNVFTEANMGINEVVNLWNWRPFNMSIDFGRDAYIPLRYWFNKGGKGSRSWDVKDGSSLMLHWRDFNPDPDANGMGMGPLQAAARSADTHNAATDWRYQQQRNGATIKGIITPDTTEPMNPKVKEQLERDLNDKFKGSGQAGETFGVSNGKLNFLALSQSMKEAEWLLGTKLNKQETTEVFGIPGQLIGIENSLTFANYGEARQAFYEDKVLPECDLYCSELNRWLVPKIQGEENLKVRYFMEDIPALEPRRTERRLQKINSGAYSINEIRAEFGDEPVDEAEADVIMVDPNKLPLGLSSFTEDEAEEKAAVASFMRMGMSLKEAEQKVFELSERMG